MKLYAETSGLRARQLLVDLATLAWTAAWVWAGLTLYRLVEKLAAPGARLERAGGGFAGDVAEIQQKIGRLPVVGDDLRTRSAAWPAWAGPWPTPARPSRRSSTSSRSGWG